MKQVFSLLFCTILLITKLAAQTSGSPALQSLRHPNKFKNLPLNRDYDLYTAADTFYLVKIMGADPDSLIVFGRHQTGKDSLFRMSFKNKATKKWYDSLVLSPIYHDDTFRVAVKDIGLMKRDWFRSRGWMLPFAYFAGGAVLGLVFGPIAVLANGNKGWHDWLRFEAVLTGLSAPALFLGTRTHKYDLKQKWKLVLR